MAAALTKRTLLGGEIHEYFEGEVPVLILRGWSAIVKVAEMEAGRCAIGRYIEGVNVGFLGQSSRGIKSERRSSVVIASPRFLGRGICFSPKRREADPSRLSPASKPAVAGEPGCARDDKAMWQLIWPC